MNKKVIAPCMVISGEMTESDRTLLQDYDRGGADELLLFDFSNSSEEHEQALLFLRDIARKVDAPILCGGYTPRFEDVKKLLYAGAKRALVDVRPDTGIEVLKEGAARFGKEKLAAYAKTVDDFFDHAEDIKKNCSLLVSEESIDTDFPVLVISKSENVQELIDLCMDETVYGISGSYVNGKGGNITELKAMLKEQGCPVSAMEGSIPFSALRTGENGLIPVVVQDYLTNQVLMVAYMNEEAYEQTLKTGKLTYYSRSRSCLWVKGETSGHFQYVKSLSTDCDSDTLLAKVAQIGPACHTGSTSCFFKEIMKKNYREENPLTVFERVYDVITDRKQHPKEGSYTNYLFDKGIDKILKKVGEEAAEIIIAAKNPEPEEIKYEIADFLYHVMVLMAEKEITWKQITDELENR